LDLRRGEAKARRLCQHIAGTCVVAAQVGDPWCGWGISEIGIESGIAPPQPQPVGNGGSA